MLRRLHLVLAALAMLFAPIATQAGVAMAMPMDHREMAQKGQCGDSVPGKDAKFGVKSQCCMAMCSAVTPLGAAPGESVAFQAPLLFGLRPSDHRPFLAELPTPPPRTA